MKPRAITGLGIVSALGTAEGPSLEVLQGKSPAHRAIAPVASFDASPYANPNVLEVPGFDPAAYLGDKGLRTLDRLTKLLLVAARLSLQDAHIKRDGAWVALEPEHVGVCCSNAYGSLEAITELDRVSVLEDARYINPSKFPNTVSNSASGYVSIWEDLRALNVSVSDGNCGALDAFSCADLLLASGRAKAIATGGGESMSEALFLAFDRLRALGKAGAGAFLGEGASFAMVEPHELATRRGARIRALVRGYGTSFVAPSDDSALLFATAESVERAIADALQDANISASDVDVVVSGLSGIAPFDEPEKSAIVRAFGEDVAIAAPKQLFGETLGASGALGVAAALAWLDGGSPPCLVAGEVNRMPGCVLITATGYYGNASALVLTRA